MTAGDLFYHPSMFLVLDNAKGKCELHHMLGQFIDKKTEYHFLEVHHVIPLAKTGTDTIENATAPCP